MGDFFHFLVYEAPTGIIITLFLISAILSIVYVYISYQNYSKLGKIKTHYYEITSTYYFLIFIYLFEMILLIADFMPLICLIIQIIFIFGSIKLQFKMKIHILNTHI